MATATSLKARAESELKGFSGELIGPEDANYDEVRAVYNAMIDRHPGLIARCHSANDVAAVVNYAREHDTILAVRGGGHNGGGLGTVDDGIVIDLSPMKDIKVDAAAKTVRVEGGCLWKEVDAATAEVGMATPSGIIGTTGVGGLTLGGGIGHLSRSCGLSIDNVLEAEMVLADGSQVTANATENSDLYWAIRGGGGNFGVVTAFTFRLHPVGTVVAGPTFWSLEESEQVLKAYRDFIPAAPRELNGFFAFLTVPPGPPFPEELHGRQVCGIVWHYNGSPEDAAKAMAPMLEVGTPLMHGAGEVPHSAMQGAFDALYPKGEQWYWRADFVRELSDAAIAEHVKWGNAAALRAVDHAHVPDRRSGARRGRHRHAVQLPRRAVGRGDRGRRSRSGQRAEADRLDDRLLGGDPPALRRRRLRQLHDGRRPGAGEGDLSPQLRPAGTHQGRT